MVLFPLLFHMFRYVDAKVSDYLIRYFASVRGAKRGERFDLCKGLAAGFGSVRVFRTFGFFLNILCDSRQLSGYCSESANRH